MKGQNLGRLKQLKREKREKVARATAQELRQYISDKSLDLIDVVIDAAVKDKDVLACKLLLDKILPTLKATEITSDTQLPTLIINQLVAPQLGSNTMKTVAGGVSTTETANLSGVEAKGPPHFLNDQSSTSPTVDNFAENGTSSNSLGLTGIQESVSTPTEEDSLQDSDTGSSSIRSEAVGHMDEIP